MAISANKNPSLFLVVLAYATVYIVWGSTYFFIKQALDGFPPMVLGAVRFIIAGVILMLWSLFKGEKMLSGKHLLTASITGVLLLFVGNGIVIWVEQYLPTGMVAIVISASPIWFILLDKPKWTENLKSRSTIAGLIIGFAGVLLLFSESIMNAFSDTTKSIEIGWLGLVVFGSLSWAAGSLHAKYKAPAGSSMNTSWQMLAAGLAFVPGSFFTGELQQMQWRSISPGAWYSLIYLVFAGSIAAYSAYVWLLKVRPAAQVSTYAYVNPVVAVLLGVYFAHENISVIQVIGLVIILGSVLLVNLVKYSGQRNLNRENAVLLSQQTEPALAGKKKPVEL